MKRGKEKRYKLVQQQGEDDQRPIRPARKKGDAHLSHAHPERELSCVSSGERKRERDKRGIHGGFGDGGRKIL